MKFIKPIDLSNPIESPSFLGAPGTYWSKDKVMTVSASGPRFNYNPATGVYEGVLIELASTNLLLNSETPSNQTITVVDATTYTLSFYGTGTVTVTGKGSATGTGTYNKTTFTFTATGTSQALTFSGTVKYAQVEQGTKATSWIPTTGSTASRANDQVINTGLLWTDLEDTTAFWNSGTTYAVDALVRVGRNIYQSLQASNTNHPPATSPTWWILKGPDNTTAAFDQQISTVSTKVGSMSFIVKPGQVFDALSMINVDSIIAEIAVNDPVAGIVFTKTVGLSGEEVYDWYQYFFSDPLLKRTQMVVYGIPQYAAAVVSIKLTGDPAAIVSVASVIFGAMENLGLTQYGAQAGIIDYSVKSTDEFGVVTFVKRNFSKRLSAQVWIENFKLNRAMRSLYTIRATPVVWIGAEDPRFEEALIFYGFYKEFSTDLSYPTYSVCSLEIEGLT